MIKTLVKPFRALICAALATLGLATAHAQTTANWIGPATGGEWNTGANWDTGFPPLDATTNAFIDTGTNVSYTLPMTATGFGSLTLNGILNVNTNGFNTTGITMVRPGGGVKLILNTPGAAVNVSGSLIVSSNASVTLSNGAVSANTLQFGAANTAGSSGFMTNFAGTINATNIIINNNNASASSMLMIIGGTNNLGNVTINRAGPSSQPAIGTEGLVISNGVVNATSLTVGGSAANSFLTMFVGNGIVTNTGALTVHLTSTANRPARFLQTGGYVVTTEPNIATLAPQAAATATTVYSVVGGTNFVGGFQFGDLSANIGTVNFTNSATIYVGAEGMNSNGAVTLNALMNNGSLLGATADWAGNASLLMNSGTFTIQAAGPDATTHNITLSGILRGSGSLNKTGAGTLTLTAPNTFSGITFVKNGTLALATDLTSGSIGSIASGNLNIGAGATFDVSQLTGYSINPLQTLAGFGTVNGSVTVSSTGIINPGSNAVTGTLTFNNDLIETNGAVNHFDVSGDVINVGGALNLSGSNVVEIAGSLPLGTPYALFHYGTFSGSVGSLGISGAEGVLSNSVTDKAIYIVVTAILRPNTNMTWVGNSVVNDWDTHNTTNWVNAGTGALDSFLSGDKALFTDLGGNNTNVNIPGTVSPASVLVNSTSNYVFSGIGQITGPNTTLTKTNSGNLTILTTNTYAGATIFSGGVVDIMDIENGGIASPLGSSPADSASLAFNGGTLEYLGGNQTVDRGATFQTNGGVLSITNGTTLTMNGTLSGVGSLTKIGNGQLNLSAPNNYQGGTVISAGTIRAAQGGGVTISTFGTNAITLNGNASAATLNFGGDAEVLNNTLNIVNTNNFISNGGNDQVLNITGNGLVNLEGGSGNVLTIAGDMTAFTGTFYVDTLSNLRFLPNSGTLVGSSNAVFNLGVGSGLLNNRNGNLTTLVGTLWGGPNTLVQGASSTDNRPTTYVIGLNNSSSSFDGRFTEVSALRKVNLVKSGTGAFVLTGASSYTGFTTVSNGVLALATSTNTFADGDIGSSTNIEITANGILDVSLRSDGTLQLNGSQTLAGSGVLRGSVNANGVVAPDGGTPNTTGTLTVTNVANLFNLTWMKLSGGSVPANDKLVSPTINLGGTLVITNAGGALHAGDTFTLFSGTLVGSFGSIITPNYYTFNTTQLTGGGNGTVTVTSYTPPVMKTDFSAFSSGTITFNVTGGIVGNGVSILSSTNLALPLTNWTTAVSGNFDVTGAFSAPVSVDPSMPQQYYIMLTQ